MVDDQHAGSHSGSRRVALALGSGGARGYAHIGVIRALQERGFEVAGVAGTSMGALVGGLYAAGKLDDYAEWVGGLSQRDVLRLLDPGFRAAGMFRGEKIMARVSELLGGVRCEDLDIPFTAVATDLTAQKEVWFQQGPVDVAIRASIALPPVFAPVMLNGRLLADGGMLNPIPLVPLTAIQSDLTVAVSLSGLAEGELGHGPAKESAEPEVSEDRLGRLRRTSKQLQREGLPQLRWVTDRFGSWRDGDAAATQPDEAAAADSDAADASDGADMWAFGSLPVGLGVLAVMEMSVEAMQSAITRYRLAGYPPDVLITLPRDACGTLDFHRAGEMIELGYRTAVAALDRAPVS